MHSISSPVAGSGIAGLCHLGGGVAGRAAVEGMVHALAHRGPGGSGLWSVGAAALGQVRLQPAGRAHRDEAPYCEGPFVIVADARLDNRAELIGRLGGEAGPLPSDAALILRAYARWGEACLDHLLGDFAFAIWDGARRRLFCARDPLGVKPFYYVAAAHAVAFASEIKALFALPWVPCRVNETRVADYLSHQSYDPQATFYEDILRLPPAHVLLASGESVVLRRYWSLDPDRQVRLETDEAYAGAFRELFEEAVRSRLRSPGPVGTMLSGGLDSSAITCMARRLLAPGEAHPLPAFSNVFDALPQCDERPYIGAVLAQGGLRSHFEVADGRSLFEDLDRMLWHLDEPFLTPNLFLSWHLWKRAGNEGVRVLLDGFLGDNVVSHGNRYLTELAASFRWVRLARELRRIRQLHGGRAASAWQLLHRYAAAPLLLEPLRKARGGASLPHPAYSRYLRADFMERVSYRERAAAHEMPAARSVRAGQYEELTSAMLPEALEIANKAAAASGVELRLPFSDRRLVEFCLALPPTQKYRDGWTRVVFRRAMADVLPEEIQWRQTKADVSSSFQRAMLLLGRAEMDSCIFDRVRIASAYLDADALQQGYRRMCRNYEQYGHSGMSPLPFWLAALLTRWLEVFQNRPRPSPGFPPVPEPETSTPGLRPVCRGFQPSHHQEVLHEGTPQPAHAGAPAREP